MREVYGSHEPRRVGAAEALRLASEGGYVVVDVRTEIEFAAGHPMGAVNVPLLVVDEDHLVDNADAIAAIERLVPERSQVVLVCNVGRATQTLARKLVHLGFVDVVDVVGGIDGLRDAFGSLLERGWRGLGLPLEVGEDAGAWKHVGERLEGDAPASATRER
jgi:rhodanese-related sulfurtransferase